jgi:hypothetical protein
MRSHFAAGLVLLTLTCLTTAASADGPVRLSASFGPGARLGGKAPLRLGFEVDDQRVPFPATEIRIFAPAGIDIGDLGVATCRPPSARLAEVLFSSSPAVPCPRNAVIGRGAASAALMFDPEVPTIRTAPADFTLYAGEAQENRPGLLVVAKTINPVYAQLAYAGRLSPARRPFGLEFALQMRAPADPPFGADIALIQMRVTIGQDDLFYTRPAAGRRRFYRPGGVGLPSRCPRGGLPFRAELRFAHGGRHTAETRVPCPPAAARRGQQGDSAAP